MGQRFFGPFDNGSSAGVGLKAAEAAATAGAGIGHLNFHVTQLGAVTMLALEDHVPDYDSAADTGAEREKHHAVDVAAGADPEFTVSRCIGVVLERRRNAENVLHVIAHRYIAPRFEI